METKQLVNIAVRGLKEEVAFPERAYSIFTHSVGYHTSSHSLLAKLSAIAAAGFKAIELFTEDLWAFSQSAEFLSMPPNVITSHDSPFVPLDGQGETKVRYNAFGECTKQQAEQELAAARYLKSFCADLGLEVLCLQPMRNIEGHLEACHRALAINRVRSRFPILRALGCKLLLVCSSFTQSSTSVPSTTGDLDVLVSDFIHISDLASRYTEETGHEIRIGYEALSWGTHVSLWSQAWAVVRFTSRSNFGLVLDSFNTLARELADPCTPSFLQEPADITLFNLSCSLQRLAHTVDGGKVFLLQVGDAERLREPLTEEAVGMLQDVVWPSRMRWSRSSRLYPCEEVRGGFMPVDEFVQAVLTTGYRGPWSIEVFNDSLAGEGHGVINEHAKRAVIGLEKLYQRLLQSYCDI